MVKKISVLICSISMVILVQAQFNIPTFSTQIDKQKILLGDEIKYTIKAIYNPQQYALQWTSLPDTINTIEIISKNKIDTTEAQSSREIKQSISLSSYDSGAHTIPSLEATFTSLQGGSPVIINTSPITIEVSSPVVDTSKAPMPIYDIEKAPFPTSLIMLAILLGLIAIIILYNIYQYIKKRNTAKNNTTETQKIKIAPHTLALQQLQTLEQKEYWQHENEKLYHTELTDVIRNYLEQQFTIDCFEKTSDELLATCIKNKQLKKYNTPLATILHTADLVKFAKSKPLPEQHNQSMQLAKEYIYATYNEYKIQQDKLELQKQKNTKQ